jgi:hypothetical protein
MEASDSCKIQVLNSGALDQRRSVLMNIAPLKNKFFTKGKPEQHSAFGMTPSASALFSP